MQNINDLVIKMFNHFAACQELKKPAIRRTFIEQFTPAILKLNEEYSRIVEEKDIKNFGFHFVSSIYFERHKKSYFKGDDMIEFDFKNRTMSISNADNEYHYLIQNATVNDLNTFYCIMYSLGFSCA